MKALGRNMRYWLGTLEKQGLLILAYVLAIAAVVAFLGSNGFAEDINCFSSPFHPSKIKY